MTMVYRLKVAAAILGVTTAITSAFVWGEVGSKKPIGATTPVGVKISENFEVGNRFSKEPVVTYENQNGETFFALQLKPDVPASEPRPRDILIMVDTSASQAGKFLLTSREVAKQVVADLAVTDRASIWVANTPKATRNLSKQLAAGKSPAVQSALKALEAEYPSGAVDLKGDIETAMKEFEGYASRQQIILYIGDGESAMARMTEKDRNDLAMKLRVSNVQFFACPIGMKINPENLHTLVMGTGGAVVRMEAKDPKNAEAAAKSMVARLNAAIRTPVLMPTEYSLNANVAETYPTRLPPLRADVPVLLVGRFEKGKVPAELKATIKGTVIGKEGKRATEVTVSEKVPAASIDNFFLNSVVAQWKDSPLKDAPALLRADRTLALAYEQGRLNRDEYLTQFNWALGVNQVDAAKNLVDAAAAIDPTNPEVKAGLKIIDKLKSGKLTIEQLKANVGQRIGVRYEKQADGKLVAVRQNLEEIALQQDPVGAPKVESPAPVGDPQALLRAEAARRAVEEQKVRLAVEESLYRGRERLRDADPKAAKDLIVAQRDSVRSNPDISEATRARLLDQMEKLLQEIGARGESIVRAKALADEALAKARSKITNQETEEAREGRIKERIRNFNSLMAQARYEDAYREALVMQQEKITRGEPVPIETQAIYQMGQAATNLREMRELTRIREDRFLLTMMQVEKSHIPYPDEPPVHFPPSRVWRDLRDSRKEYASTELGNDIPARTRKRMEFLRSALETPISIGDNGQTDFELKPLLSALEDFATPPGADKDPARKVKILVDDKAFKDETAGMWDPDRPPTIKLPGKLAGVSLSTALRLITQQIDGTFWVRRDYIEIVPSGMAIREKVIRVYPVEDLVVPIPNSVNRQVLNQNLAVLGAQASLGGNGPAIAGAFGGFGGGFQFGVGFGGGAAANQGQQNAVGQLFAGGANRGGGANNLGFGGGVAGFGGGQLGQFGNLGGQFGFQGGDQSTLLVRLITEVVAKGEWTNAPQLLGGGGAGAGAGDDMDGGENVRLSGDQLNSLGYYPPARALVIRGTSRFHSNQSSKISLKKMGGDAKFVPGQVRANLDDNAPKRKVVKFDPKPELKGKEMNPEKIYQEALAKGDTDAGEIIASVDFMVQCREFKHAAELLKAGLRTGIVAEPWAQEALAMALEGSQGSTEEIERARLSPIDLEPKSPLAYIKAAKSMSAMGDPDRAIRFCKEAARIEPNLPEPYMNALVYAGDAKATGNVATDVWAAQNLLGRDWTIDSNEYHLKAREHLKALTAKLTSQNKPDDVKSVQTVLESDKRRDLVIQLLWTGSADLDLKVNEAIGTTCSSLNKQTTAGGTLLCDDFSQKDDNHSETYTASQAFNGVYRVSVDRVWGAPLNNQATIKVIRHQGTPDEQVEIHTIAMNQKNSVSVVFDGGRRTALATVPPPGFAMDTIKKVDRERGVIDRLRAMTGSASRGVAGTTAGAGISAEPGTGIVAKEEQLTDFNMQVSVNSSLPNGLDMRQQTTVLKNGDVRFTMAPVFETVSANLRKPKLDLIPGNGD